MAGRPRTPTNLKLVKGNPGKRGAPKSEPDPMYLNDLTAPAHLPQRAKDVWNDLAPKLRAVRLLAEIDVPALEMTCIAIANHRYATQRAGDEMMRVNEENGMENLSPWVIVQSMSFKQAFLALSRFGMTPADRSRVLVNPQSDLFENDKKSRFFGE